MISADQALELVLSNVAPLGVERVSIREAAGRVLAAIDMLGLPW